MLRFSRLAGITAAALFALMMAAPAQAQATRTWVSGVGNDANPCSLTAPCKTFAGAYSKTAAGGEIDALDPGGFGTVTIAKSLTLDGGGGQVASVLNTTATNGIVVTTGAGTVTIRNLTINGAGSGLNGIRVLTAAAVSIVNTIVAGNTGTGIDIEPSGAGAQVFLSNVNVHDNGTNGILVKGTGGAATQLTMDNVFLAKNVNGLRVEDGGKVSVIRTTVTGSTNGIQAVSASTASAIVIEASMAAGNTNGLVTSGANASIVISNTALYNNATAGISSPTGTVYTFGNNHNANNGTPGPVHAPPLPLQ